jgi:hypothetical protein
MSEIVGIDYGTPGGSVTIIDRGTWYEKVRSDGARLPVNKAIFGRFLGNPGTITWRIGGLEELNGKEVPDASNVCAYCGNRSRERDRRGNCIACGGPR